ncbi:MAG: bifunctional phosphoribosylaminoimidazolecarboxamide formyltransferase/IMP cyclohydrolase [Chloroflexota bacterium]|nr:bifunctional phosphoribosylaminoimidazolecarboxamide formyltransferase/IMP cyclohydrolase [Chloroflexota bacterium]MDE2961961.1 bifunctional phosphoribosylaminoimidazolecarboxamide formyltransferase/IMP cyclohydrolase [Chloroflexota bacterium]
MKALLSVFDKTGIEDFGKALVDAGYELISTGGTHRSIADAGVPVTQVSDVTGSPEILEGRVKTLHPVIHGGLLARRDSPAHMAELEQHGIGPIDVVVVNLYPFVETISKPGVSLDDALENIDIGGPTMLRAAAKNFPSVAVVVDPSDYEWVAEALSGPGLDVQQRRGLATKAFQHVAVYDAAVADYLAKDPTSEEEMPQQVTIGLTRVSSLRYGENPHQRGALYVPASGGEGGLARATQLHGRELSFNNLMDADAAWRTVSDYADPSVCVIKHANPCGLASRDDIARAYELAYEGDPVSAFGGIVGFNRNVTADAAQAMDPVFYEVVVAPGYDDDALEILRRKRNLRILTVDRVAGAPGSADYDVRPLSGGVLVQTPDAIDEDPEAWATATERAPTPAELADLAFAWKAVKHIKSNAIAFVKDRTLVGMGAGQPNRVVSVHLSQRAAGDKAAGCVLASDAFFPFPDNIELAAEAGITAIVQPGGSIRDDEVIAAANQAGIAMVFTGVRHFRH